MNMENQVWEKVTLFLKELRCEDIKRHSIIHLDSCKHEREYLETLKETYDREIVRLSNTQQKIIAEYIEQIQVVPFEEQQEAYCQGIMDCVQILFGIGVIKIDKKLIKLFKKLM